MFIAPFILAGLLAIGLPIWLHRVARANPTQFPFASHMFLEQSETQRTAKRTLRYLLLLAARILLGLVVAAVGIVGDLFESLLKRSVNMKDASVIIPGHGGVLDRIDALLFAAPVYYLFCSRCANSTKKGSDPL